MKKVSIFIITVLLLITITPVQSIASTTDPVKKEAVKVKKPEDAARAEALVNRLEEIKAMDKTTLTSSEKKKLRKETRSIKGQLKAISGGIYLSSGAIILILLLIILL